MITTSLDADRVPKPDSHRCGCEAEDIKLLPCPPRAGVCVCACVPVLLIVDSCLGGRLSFYLIALLIVEFNHKHACLHSFSLTPFLPPSLPLSLSPSLPPFLPFLPPSLPPFLSGGGSSRPVFCVPSTAAASRARRAQASHKEAGHSHGDAAHVTIHSQVEEPSRQVCSHLVKAMTV